MPDAVQDASQASAGVSPPESGNATPPGGGNAGSEPNDADRNWKALREDRDALRDRVFDLESRLNASAANAPKAANGAPSAAADEPATRKTLADFKFDETAYEAYLEDRIQKQARKAAREELDADNEKRQKAERRASFEERSTEFAKANPDYTKAISNPRFVQSDNLTAEILGSKLGPQVALYLANNLDETNRINRMNAVDTAREVARIEARLEAAKAATGGTGTNQLSGSANGTAAPNLPNPPPTIDGSGNAGVKKDTAKMTDAEWYKDREERRRKR